MNAPSDATTWAGLPQDLLRLVFSALSKDPNRDTSSPGTVGARTAARLWAGVAQCRHWRQVARSELAFHVCLEPSDLEDPLLGRHLATLPVAELTLPPVLARAEEDGEQQQRQVDLLLRSPFAQQVQHALRALHGLLPSSARAHAVAGCKRLECLTLQGGLPRGSDDMLSFPAGTWPPSLRHLDITVPHHPFRLAAGLPETLHSLTLRCAQDFLLTHSVLVGAQWDPAPRALPRRWRHLAVHAGRAAGLDLDDLRALPQPPGQGEGVAHGSVAAETRAGTLAAEAGPPAGTARSITLAAPIVMLSTSDPAVPALLAAPPVRPLGDTLGQHLAVVAPVLAQAGVAQLCIIAGEVSFYCRRPGRLGIVDAAALPPAGAVCPAARVQGYKASLTWPAAAHAPTGCGGGGSGGDSGAAAAPAQGSLFELCFERAQLSA